MIERKIDDWGRAVYRGEDVIELLFCDCDISKLCITATPEIEAYNRVCDENDKSGYAIGPIVDPTETPDEAIARRQGTWWVPEPFGSMNVRSELLGQCLRPEEIQRVNLEMDMFEERGLLPVLRLMLYLVDRWRSNGVVWGVGRGSSSASYCLFLIGIHKINAILYDLDINEFLK